MIDRKTRAITQEAVYTMCKATKTSLNAVSQALHRQHQFRQEEVCEILNTTRWSRYVGGVGQMKWEDRSEREKRCARHIALVLVDIVRPDGKGNNYEFRL